MQRIRYLLVSLRWVGLNMGGEVELNTRVRYCTVGEEKVREEEL